MLIPSLSVSSSTPQAILGAQMVITLVMVSIIQKLSPHFSLAKWLLCSTGLTRYLHPTDNELKTLAGEWRWQRGNRNSGQWLIILCCRSAQVEGEAPWPQVGRKGEYVPCAKESGPEPGDGSSVSAGSGAPAVLHRVPVAGRLQCLLEHRLHAVRGEEM